MNKIRNHAFWYLLGIEGCLVLEYFITSNFSVIEAIFAVSVCLILFLMGQAIVIQNLRLAITKKSNILFFIYVRLFSICWFVIVSSIGIISVATIFYEDFICHGIYLKSILLIVVILLIVLNFINCMLWTNYKIWYWVFQTNLDYKRYTLKYWICRLWTLLKNLCKIVIK
ncbi:hypothetical protein [Ligilactobacillus aviarius]|uniref:hypothetical protein n=1 Tax=Ligilactobacillus aviarius TaxID=1606 RepID=UPI0024BAF02F|nr:hypothetical protein [Ligilactobacillus aviarius]